MKHLIVIPARGGSKGVPRKNIKLLNGKPLIQYTIDAAREVFEDDQILVSTDDEEIRYIVEKSGLSVPFLRPAELAHDDTGTYEVLMHVLDTVEEQGRYPDVLILLQPTSPFRQAHHIQEALNLYSQDFDMVVSVKETSSNPYYVLKEESEDGFLISSKAGNFKTRQECPKVWELNGATYIINVAALKNSPMNKFERVKKYVMDEKSSIDIDTPEDFYYAEFLLNGANRH